MERLKHMEEVLMGQLSHLDTEELGQAIDMIKDLEQAKYYCSIVKAMQELSEDIVEMIDGASPEERQVLEKKMTNKIAQLNLNINGVSWRILLVPPTSSTLARSDGSLASGVCDNDTKCIYINENLNSSLMKRVLCHEITHAAMKLI